MDAEPHLLFLWQETKGPIYAQAHWAPPPPVQKSSWFAVLLIIQPALHKRRSKKYSSPFTIYLKSLSSSAKTQACTPVIS